MDINSVFPSNYIKADDLKGRDVTVIIERVDVVTMDDKKVKPCVYFRGKEKGLLLNKTNSMNIAEIYGPETGGWIGQPIVIGPSWVDFQGKSTLSIRVRPIRPATPTQHAAAVAAQAPIPAPAQPNPNADAYDDEIPFSPQVD